MAHAIQSPIHSDSLADVLERVLDKGVVIAGDVVVSLVGIELLSIKLRLLITTVDKATEMGIDWWRFDPQLSSAAAGAQAAEGAPALGAHDPMSTLDAMATARTEPIPAPEPSSPTQPQPSPETRDTERELRGRIAMLERRIADLGG